MAASEQNILRKMLDRLFAALVNGPNLNCRPHSSRQRLDLVQLAKLRSLGPEDILRALLGEPRACKVDALAEPPEPQPKPPEENAGNGNRGKKKNDPGDQATEKVRQPDPEPPNRTPPKETGDRGQDAYTEQGAVLHKLRVIAEDARTYENDTGVHVLQVGFPLLNLPPGKSRIPGMSRRIVAPLAFLALDLEVKTGARPSVALTCRNEGVDLVVPNLALLAWLERQTGQAPSNLFADDKGADPWAEIASIVRAVCGQLSLEVPALFRSGSAIPGNLSLRPSPRADEDGDRPAIVPAAVIGLFPMANQGLLRDTQALIDAGPPDGPVRSFLEVDPTSATASDLHPEPELPRETRRFDQERLVAFADPCQGRAVKLARTSKALVVHGPPGTGKSQTITNIIGDHLARGERVLFVCDKRTALDVVRNRLEGLGLGDFCAVVHDPQRDQRDLYRSIREQLENLNELRTEPAADADLARLDQELQRLHGELADIHRALMQRPDEAVPSFHELVGRWSALPERQPSLEADAVRDLAPEDVEAAEPLLREILDRGLAANFAANSWATAAGLSLESYLSTPLADLRSTLRPALDAVAALALVPRGTIPPFPLDRALAPVGQARAELAVRLRRIAAEVAPAVRRRWAEAPPEKLYLARRTLDDARGVFETAAAAPLDAELLVFIRADVPPLPRIAQDLAILRTYLDTAHRWFGFLLFGRKKAAAQVLARYGFTLSIDQSRRLHAFLSGLKARLLLQGFLAGLGMEFQFPLAGDMDLLHGFRSHLLLFDFLAFLPTAPDLADISPAVRAALTEQEVPPALLDGLAASPDHADRLARCEQALSIPLLADAHRQALVARLRSDDPPVDDLRSLERSFDSLETILRVRHGLETLAAPLRSCAAHLLTKSVSGDDGLLILRKATLGAALRRRLEADPCLVLYDAPRIDASFRRYRELEARKRNAALAAIRHLWGRRQKQRLLASTGSRLNGDGAEVRRRLTLRGERALRLRQVLELGDRIEGGDPLFDLRPIWLASPETVAQIFPRRPLFDVVVFDEASQCRLEESLPVLVRAHRVVIAGDPKQLPPTRFFESAVAVSEEDEIETDQDLFVKQQGEMEDLLSAALNLEIEEAYLDVHYRSRNADLIAFSNEQFYNSRLQAIPGHPAHRVRYAPLTLYRADGIYQDRANRIEADRVCAIVKDLLRRADPPSIGIVSFNIAQRDLIVERLEETAAADPVFSQALAAARERRGGGSFEGLFVKNLENVQGDERDHMIISTTYGPDPQGRFYRRFGPVGRADGGRRLNVLVTRAREEVHLVTSIPPAAYRHLPPIPPGASPGGAWLLFSYLNFAEFLARAYEENHQRYRGAEERRETLVSVRPTRFPSDFACRLADMLRTQHSIGSDVHWGNDGFCVDLALHHPGHPEDVTLGVQVDLNRFEQAADPVEWEVFRNAILESQGWRIHRIWSPHFFRDPGAEIRSLQDAVDAFLASEPPRDAFPVRRE